MSTQDEPTRDQAAAPTLRTEPAEGAPSGSRWQWGKIPHHLGRARTSTVVLSLLFLAIGTLYLNVRPDQDPAGTTPAGGSSEVEAPAQPAEPSAPAAPGTSTEPEPTSGPEETSEAPTTGRTPGTSGPTTTPTQPTTGSRTPTGTSEPTTGTTAPDEPTGTSVPAP